MHDHDRKRRDRQGDVRHILPNAIGTILVQTTMSISFVILQAATLSFVGMGIKAPTPEWAFMLSEAKEFMRGSIYLMIFPGACICLAALSSNLVGDGLRDALDPRLKN
ncbi:MAG: ABC transporter permease [Firmicutes bacterium]|nr:ABC transporter permease [Bacillota bacterium]